jgi:hypothetical protein
MEDHALEDNFLCANDYPRHEGTWPHSSEAIERQMDRMRETSRRKVLGENAPRLFGFKELSGHY